MKLLSLVLLIVISSFTISLRELAHHIPKRAQKEYAIAMKAFEKQQEVEATRHLKEAVAIDPEFLSAINNLGVMYARTNQLDESIEHFNRAIAINPGIAYLYGNLAIVYLVRRGYEDAERAARQSLNVDPSNIRAMLFLGISLVKQNKFTKEAEHNLRVAASELPRKVLARSRTVKERGRRGRRQSVDGISQKWR